MTRANLKVVDTQMAAESEVIPAKKTAKATKRRRRPKKEPVSQLSLAFLKLGARGIAPEKEFYAIMDITPTDPRQAAGIGNASHFPLDQGAAVVELTFPKIGSRGFEIGRKTMTVAFNTSSYSEFRNAHLLLKKAFTADVRAVQATGVDVTSTYFPPVAPKLPLSDLRDAMPTMRMLNTDRMPVHPVRKAVVRKERKPT